MFLQVVDMLKVEDMPKKTVFCRCWKSKKFPYCDGAHAKHNQVGCRRHMHLPSGPLAAAFCRHLLASTTKLGEQHSDAQHACSRSGVGQQPKVAQGNMVLYIKSSSDNNNQSL
jgi:CDGSH-type Zn-finger protein